MLLSAPAGASITTRRAACAGTTTGGGVSLVAYPEVGLSVALASNMIMTASDALAPIVRADLFV